jgi:hypothetical protein
MVKARTAKVPQVCSRLPEGYSKTTVEPDKKSRAIFNAVPQMGGTAGRVVRPVQSPVTGDARPYQKPLRRHR